MSIPEFNTLLNSLLDKLLIENNELILMGDFNINLLNSSSDSSVDQFLDSIGSFPNNFTYKDNSLFKHSYR